MQILYPAAKWKPLGSAGSEPFIGTPRVLIFHTMYGYLEGTDSMFRKGGYDGTESHFGVGDGGLVYQWQRIDRQADAQYAGNAYATSVETEDRTHPEKGWTDKQLDALVALATWWCLQTRNPAALVSAPTGRGMGYHRQFAVWNRAGHLCPGAAREKQLKTLIIPRVAKALNQPVPPGGSTDPGNGFTYRPEDGDGLLELWEYDTSRTDITDLQKALLALRYDPGAVDGYFGGDTRSAVVAFQVDNDLDPDGIVGPKTRAAMRAAKPRPVVPFPLPPSDWFGPPDADPRNHSGYFAAGERKHIQRVQKTVGAKPDGLYGKETSNAVRDWQERHEIAADGLTGRRTWPKMFG